jgi:hypothetical protein
LAGNWYLAGVAVAIALTAHTGNAQTVASLSDLPDNPSVQQAAPAGNAPAQPQPSAQQQPSQPQTSTQQQTPAQQTSTQPAQTSGGQSSADQLKQEEHQRIMGIMPTFNMTNNKDALPLTPKQKFQLFFKSTTDPWAFGLAAIDAGIGQARNSPPEWHGGVEGYAKRFGAGYADTFDGNLWGNAILTSWWHEDPRYYRKGSGTVMSRGLWAAESSFWCKRDKGTWGFSYANIIGNLIGGSIANAYYPPSQQGIGPTLEHSASVTAYGILGSEFIEFWPDIANHYVRKHREKQEREAAKHDAQQKPATTAP